MPKLLLITADTVLAFALSARLAQRGFQIEHRSAGHAGLARARHWSPDLIVLDLMLPGMNGLQVLKWLRDVPWLVKVPVALLVERTLERDALKECLFWGAAGYLEKDVCPIGELVGGLETIYRLNRSTQSQAPPTVTAAARAGGLAAP